jgi:hypothetical protein
MMRLAGVNVAGHFPRTGYPGFRTGGNVPARARMHRRDAVWCCSRSVWARPRIIFARARAVRRGARKGLARARGSRTRARVGWLSARMAGGRARMNLPHAGIILNAAGVGLRRARMIFGRARTNPKAAGMMWFAAGKEFFNFGMGLRRAGISFVCSEWFAVKLQLVSSRGRKVVSPVRRSFGSRHGLAPR